MFIKSLKTLAGVAVVSLSMQANTMAADMPGKGVTVRPAEGTNLEEKFQHQILYKALEELGYTVADPEEVSYQTIHLALGTGDADFTAVHWDPLHSGFFTESGGDEKLTKVGQYISGALQGYLVDKASYDAGVTSIDALKKPELAKRFDADNDGKADLTGCPPGWGCEGVIEHHLDAYKLRDIVTHNQGAYNAIIADTVARLDSGKPVLYYTYTPYWVSGVLVPGQNVEWIEVPFTALPGDRKANTEFKGKNLGFAVNSLRVVANNKFLEANPAAKKLFEVASLDINEISAQNLKMRNGEESVEDIARHVDEWIKANQTTFDSWVAAARS
ncbi:MAG: glycine betaine/L-proline ABC transporter substrate-binding protein ProX [Arenicella sp.]